METFIHNSGGGLLFSRVLTSFIPKEVISQYLLLYLNDCFITVPISELSRLFLMLIMSL